MAITLKLFPLLFLGACSIVGPDCTDELRISIAPTARTIAVAESFTPSVRLASCGGRERLSDTFRWRASDTLVVRVDSVTGRITGRSPGVVRVEVSGQRYGPLGSVEATVR